MKAWDFIIHNFDYDSILAENDEALIKFGNQVSQEDLK